MIMKNEQQPEGQSLLAKLVKTKVHLGIDKGGYDGKTVTAICLCVKTKDVIYDCQQPIEKYKEVIEEINKHFNVLSISEEDNTLKTI